MNILILSENFSKGGLETHIETYYHALKQEHNLYFGFGYYQKTQYLEGARIYEGFHFGPNSNIQEFLNDVERIVQIVQDNQIDVIHAHPFYSLFPAMFAANITNTKLVYTYHGRGSINFVSHANDTILYEFGMESLISKVFCVAEIGVSWINDFKKKQAVYLPNLIDENRFPIHTLGNQKKWALFSRLDVDKASEILRFLEYLPHLDIDTVDIYGEGSETKKLRQYVKEHCLTDTVFFKGYSDDVSKALEQGQYLGVIGVGRVVLEALIMNYPTILIGYGKVAGMVHLDMFHKIKNINFIPTELLEISCDCLNDQIKKVNCGECAEYQFRDVVVQEFGVHRISEYVDGIMNISFVSLDVVDHIYEDICGLDGMEENFYQSYSVFQILACRIGFYTNHFSLKNTINLYYKFYELFYSIQGISCHDYYSLHNRIHQLEQQLLQEQNTSFLTLLKRDIRKIGYKIKKRRKK